MCCILRKTSTRLRVSKLKTIAEVTRYEYPHCNIQDFSGLGSSSLNQLKEVQFQQIFFSHESRDEVMRNASLHARSDSRSLRTNSQKNTVAYLPSASGINFHQLPKHLSIILTTQPQGLPFGQVIFQSHSPRFKS